MYLRDVCLISIACASGILATLSLLAVATSSPFSGGATCHPFQWGLFANGAVTAILAIRHRNTKSMEESVDAVAHEGHRFEVANDEYVLLLKRQEAALEGLENMASELEGTLPAAVKDLREVPATLETVSERLSQTLQTACRQLHAEKKHHEAMQTDIAELRDVEKKLRAAISLLSEGHDIEAGLQDRLTTMLEAQTSLQSEATHLQRQREHLQTEQQQYIARQEIVVTKLEMLHDSFTQTLASLSCNFKPSILE